MHGDLDLPRDGGNSRADALLPLYIPYEATSARRLWLADLLVALLQRAQVGAGHRSAETAGAILCYVRVLSGFNEPPTSACLWQMPLRVRIAADRCPWKLSCLRVGRS